MSRQQRGSGGYRRTRLRKAKIEARLARRREDWSHRFSTALAARYEVVSVPDESVAGLTLSGRGDARRPGGAVSYKARVNRAVLGLAPARLIQMLAYKLEEGGGRLDRHPPDQGDLIGVRQAVWRPTMAVTARRIARTGKKRK